MTLRHVVLFGFKESVSASEIGEVVRRFAELRRLVPGIDGFEWGENCSPEGLAQGHSHAFLLTFIDAEARDRYLTHPDHVAFAEWVRPFLASATVLDYWASSAAAGEGADAQGAAR